MKLKSLYLLTFLILTHIILHLYSTRNGNFYFTVDQGRDALSVREILVRHTFPKMGPRTGAIENLFVGPFWYLVIAPGHLLFNGNPWGAVWTMVFLNSFVLFAVFKFCQRYISLNKAFLLTLGLIFFERFWFTSQFSLNPHLLPALTLGLAMSLVFVYEGKKNWFIPAGIFTGLMIHSELAFVPIAFLTFFLTSIYFSKIGKITAKLLLFSYIALFIFLIPHLFFELTKGFSQTNAVIRQIYEPTGIIGKTNFSQRLVWITKEFVKLFSNAVFPQNTLTGSLILLISIILITLSILKHQLNKSLVFLFKLTLLLLISSFLWFLQTKEFLPWHMLGMYSLVFVVLMLCLSTLKSKIALSLFFVILTSQVINFYKTYPTQLQPSSDHGLFINQVNAVDWIYKEAKGEGFNVYNYLQYVYDYPYQYTIWWRGTNKYGYLPCEYGTYPNTPSSLYFAPIAYFQQPKKECTNTRFLIIEPTTDKSSYEKWYQGVTKDTSFLNKETFGTLTVEKLLLNPT